jgi:hypothetical protein
MSKGLSQLTQVVNEDGDIVEKMRRGYQES